jgi:hypothetical protein
MLPFRYFTTNVQSYIHCRSEAKKHRIITSYGVCRMAALKPTFDFNLEIDRLTPEIALMKDYTPSMSVHILPPELIV